jgi:hypothetical protein
MILTQQTGVAPSAWGMDKAYRKRLVADYLEGKTNRNEIVAAFARYAVAARDGNNIAQQ